MKITLSVIEADIGSIGRHIETLGALERRFTVRAAAPVRQAA